MILESLNVHQFRNYESLNIHFHPKLNIFLGNNAQGKTNLLEAIYVLALAKSHRTSKDRELMMFDTDESYINGIVRTSNQSFPLSISISKQGKRAKVNHLEVAKLSEFIGINKFATIISQKYFHYFIKYFLSNSIFKFFHFVYNSLLCVMINNKSH